MFHKISDHRKFVIGAILIGLDQSQDKIVRIREVFFGNVRIAPQMILVVWMMLSILAHNELLVFWHLPAHPHLVDLFWDQQLFPLSCFQALKFYSVIQYEQFLNRSLFII